MTGGINLLQGMEGTKIGGSSLFGNIVGSGESHNSFQNGNRIDSGLGFSILTFGFVFLLLMGLFIEKY